MDDSISRQAAIKMLFDGFDYVDNESFGYILAKLKTLPSAQPERKWIPVTERLPEEMTYVLVTDKDGDVYSVKFIEVIDGQAEWVFNNGILAWMPLPEPYRAERRTDGEIH